MSMINLFGGALVCPLEIRYIGKPPPIAIGEVLCVGLMLGIYALAGRPGQVRRSGGMLGGLLSICNFFFMAVGASLAADRASSRM